MHGSTNIRQQLLSEAEIKKKRKRKWEEKEKEKGKENIVLHN